MADYLATAKTNHFRVTDEEKYQELFKHLVAGDDNIEDFTHEQEGVLYHGFGAYSSIDYRMDLNSDKCEFDFDYFLEELQKILPEDEAFIYHETGHEKLRSIGGCAIVVTSKEIRSISLSSWTKSILEELLGKDNKVNECT